MQDRFKFRAKLKNMDIWMYGAYLKMLPYQPNPVSAAKPLEKDYKHLIITEGSADWGMPREIAAYEVTAETVGQCTGLKDKNGRLIYEGDIVRFKDNITINGSKTHIAVVEHNEAFNAFMYHAECMGLYTVNKAQNKQFDIEVIGSIYETPELLEGKNE